MPPAERDDRPTYDLGNIQRMVAAGRFLVPTMPTRDHIRSLGLTDEDVKKCIASLSSSRRIDGGHFHKSMEAENERARARGLWQDVYYVQYEEYFMYVKLQHEKHHLPVIISFKENDKQW